MAWNGYYITSTPRRNDSFFRKIFTREHQVPEYIQSKYQKEDQMEQKMNYDTSRAGQSWEASEWAQLGVQYGSRLSIQTIAKIHKRTEGAIVEAFKKAGMTIDGYPGYVPEYQMKISPDQQQWLQNIEDKLLCAEARLEAEAAGLQTLRESIADLRKKLSK